MALLGALLLSAPDDASAASLGGLATSVSLLTALAVLIAINGWHALAATGAASSVVAILVGALVWLWHRTRSNPQPAFLSERSAAPAATAWRAAAAMPLALEDRSGPHVAAGSELSRELCAHFVRLQAAWDTNDAGTLCELTTPSMFAQLRSERGECADGANRTEVVTLDAEVRGHEACEAIELVWVEFSGIIREWPERDAMPFREFWMFERVSGGAEPWKLARQQVLL